MQNVNIQGMFRAVKFTKSGRELASKAAEKVAALRTKVAEREGRITYIRKQYGITDKVLADLLAAAMHEGHQTYAVPSGGGPAGGVVGVGPDGQVLVPAGVIHNLTTEQGYIASEREQAQRLELLARNVAPDASHELSFDELAYLGF